MSWLDCNLVCRWISGSFARFFSWSNVLGRIRSDLDWRQHQQQVAVASRSVNGRWSGYIVMSAAVVSSRFFRNNVKIGHHQCSVIWECVEIAYFKRCSLCCSFRWLWWWCRSRCWSRYYMVAITMSMASSLARKVRSFFLYDVSAFSWRFVQPLLVVCTNDDVIDVVLLGELFDVLNKIVRWNKIACVYGQ